MASLLWNVLGSSEIIQGHSSLERSYARSMVWLELSCLLEPKLNCIFFVVVKSQCACQRDWFKNALKCLQRFHMKKTRECINGVVT